MPCKLLGAFLIGSMALVPAAVRAQQGERLAVYVRTATDAEPAIRASVESVLAGRGYSVVAADRIRAAAAFVLPDDEGVRSEALRALADEVEADVLVFIATRPSGDGLAVLAGVVSADGHARRFGEADATTVAAVSSVMASELVAAREAGILAAGPAPPPSQPPAERAPPIDAPSSFVQGTPSVAELPPDWNGGLGSRFCGECVGYAVGFGIGAAVFFYLTSIANEPALGYLSLIGAIVCSAMVPLSILLLVIEAVSDDEPRRSDETGTVFLALHRVEDVAHRGVAIRTVGVRF